AGQPSPPAPITTYCGDSMAAAATSMVRAGTVVPSSLMSAPLSPNGNGVARACAVGRNEIGVEAEVALARVTQDRDHVLAGSQLLGELDRSDHRRARRD